MSVCLSPGCSRSRVQSTHGVKTVTGTGVGWRGRHCECQQSTKPAGPTPQSRRHRVDCLPCSEQERVGDFLNISGTHPIKIPPIQNAVYGKGESKHFKLKVLDLH